MKIYDISKELFSAEVYPGDPVPFRADFASYNSTPPSICQVSGIVMGSNSGTHLDAPLHFCPDGRDTADLDLERCIGKCRVVHAEGEILPGQMGEFLSDGVKRLLIRGNVVFGSETARVMCESGLWCIGVETMTVGTKESQIEVHQILLRHEVVILESLVLADVPEGEYFLSALPLRMAGGDGSPVRAVLMSLPQHHDILFS